MNFVPWDDSSASSEAQNMCLLSMNIRVATEDQLQNAVILARIAELEIAVENGTYAILLPELDHRLRNLALIVAKIRPSNPIFWGAEVLDDRIEPCLIVVHATSNRK